MKKPIINNKKGDDENNNSLKSSAKVKVGIAITVAAASALAILTLVYTDGTAQAFAPPPPPCPACATQIEGSGFGTITIPEGAQIAPRPCDACFATISFEAVTDAKGKVQNGTITIEYTDSEGVTQTLNGEFFDGKVGKDSFKLLGTIIQGPTPCPECADVDFVLDGKIQKGSLDSANLILKAADGTQATFDNAKVTISTIPTET
jgi:hypothetical protein